MKLSIASDIHLEFGDVTLENTDNTDILILAGDICITHELDSFPEGSVIVQENQQRMYDRAQRYRDFFKDVCSKWQYVLYVAGNHEFYHSKFHHGLKVLDILAAEIDNLYFLENDFININDVKFLGATLWTNMDNMDPLTMQCARYGMNDYRTITNDRKPIGEEGNILYSKLDPKDTIERHVRSASWLDVNARNTNQQVVVITHMAPTFASISDEFRGDPLNGAYASDLSEMIMDNTNITHWFHGHMHAPSDYMVGNCRVVANPCGYPGQIPDWKLITVEV